MKNLARISAIAALVAGLAMPAWAGPVGVRGTEVYRTTTITTTVTRANPQVIADLQRAEQNAIRDGRNGNKNNPYYGQKAAQIDRVIDRLQAGQSVDVAEIDSALAKPDLY